MRSFGRATEGKAVRVLEAELEQTRAQLEETRTGHLRLMADMDNLRKRVGRDMDNARKFALEGFSTDLLTVADNATRALAAIEASAGGGGERNPVVKSLIEGVAMIQGTLDRTLKKHGIVRIEALGKPFDPHLHQALAQVEDPSVPPGTVVLEIQAGYTLNDRLLRPTLVNVAKS
ncbi:MAG: nucleotide exchange factor GrpE [Magnetococcales bacterium]|nr:nucleotide exchange factor GrpE [Magnetococcales bacterium]